MNRKGTSNLFEEVASIDNLRRASERAMENADHETVSMRDFKEHKEERLQELHDLLISGNYQTGKYYKFTVYEPKERVICALPFYPDRIVHHACMQVLLPIWEKKFTSDAYNCLKGKGTHAFVKAIRGALDKDHDGTMYVLQIDIRHFYESISHRHLKRIIRWTIKDKRLQKFLFEIIASCKEGVPIGNYLSQFFALLFLTQFDHYVKEVIRAKYYFRYCDDMIFMAATKEELWRIFGMVQKYLQDLELTIKQNYRVFPARTGIDVVGYVFFPTHTKWRKRTKLRFEKKCLIARSQGKTGKEFKKAIGAYLGLMKYCNSYRLRRKWLGKEFNLCCNMKRFSDIAEGKDKIESYEGESISINDLMNKTVEIHSFRHIKIDGKDKVIVQIKLNNEWKYFFTGSRVIADKLDRYQDQLPFEVTIYKENNKTNSKYTTFK